MICVHILRFWLHGWQLVKIEDKPHLFISEAANMKEALIVCQCTLKEFGLKYIPTMEQVIAQLEYQAKQEE